jgi:hypothetical protein
VYNNPQSDEGNEKNPSNLERHFKALKRETTKKTYKKTRRNMESQGEEKLNGRFNRY